MVVLASIIDLLFLVYTAMLMIRIIGSWFPRFSRSRIMHFIAFYVDPYLNLFRRIIPSLGGMDFSPILAFIALRMIEYFLLMLLWS
ncbi:YggT family protein [Simkania negevensis]|uniref:YggT family protein n=1 Tax=Simkania negevensis TaxID=83561 RepID=A0ABS3APK4_9BACT|nr:YggT family protein [Simkania negevensis]